MKMSENRIDSLEILFQLRKDCLMTSLNNERETTMKVSCIQFNLSFLPQLLHFWSQWIKTQNCSRNTPNSVTAIHRMSPLSRSTCTRVFVVLVMQAIELPTFEKYLLAWALFFSLKSLCAYLY